MMVPGGRGPFFFSIFTGYGGKSFYAESSLSYGMQSIMSARDDVVRGSCMRSHGVASFPSSSVIVGRVTKAGWSNMEIRCNGKMCGLVTIKHILSFVRNSKM